MQCMSRLLGRYDVESQPWRCRQEVGRGVYTVFDVEDATPLPNIISPTRNLVHPGLL